ncbi:MAG: DNA integrity scanning diadenylate cyclase DisA [Nanoarchaeota archaeon]|nr:DNA integrity scanning diadenylate cyclase DisA [Nanoarchaeota archaeon]
MTEKELKFSDYLKKVSPGTPLRTVIRDLMSANMGALIVLDSVELSSLSEGGFKVNCKFTSNKLFELCKMDGAIVLSSDLKKILYANVLLNPDTTISTNETGTRHKAGERTAKQANTFVIVVSERRKKASLYFGNHKYILKDTTKLLGEVSSNLQLLEKQRELFNESRDKLDILEMTNTVTIGDVCNLIQRAEMILRISEMIKRYFTELGNVGSIMSLRYRELIRGVEKIRDEVLRDYSALQLKKSKSILSSFNFEILFDREVMAKLLFGGPIEDNTSTRGYRFLSTLELDKKTIPQIVSRFKSLEGIFEATPEDFNQVIKDEGGNLIREEILHVRDQILSGKRIS